MNIVFSPDPSPSKSKSKCIYVTGKSPNVDKPAPLFICGFEVPFVQQANHFGQIITEQGDTEQDTNVKRAQFLQKAAAVKSYFKFAAHRKFLKLLEPKIGSFWNPKWAHFPATYLRPF